MSTFEADISRFADKVDDRMDIFLRTTVTQIYTGVVNKTPVDTGRAQNNWNVGLNNVDPSTTPEEMKNASLIVQKAQMIIRRIKAGDVIWVSNNLDYIEQLENGSSTQTPNGMVAVTLREIPQITRSAADQAKRERP